METRTTLAKREAKGDYYGPASEKAGCYNCERVFTQYRPLQGSILKARGQHRWVPH